MVSSGLLIMAGAFVPVGAVAGGLLWLDSRARDWADRPLYQFILAGIVIVVPLSLVIIKIAAGGFSGVPAFQ